MRGDTARLGELPVTDAAVKRLFAGMGPAVRRQVGGLREGLVAVVAAVRTLPRMGPHVRLQGAGSRIPVELPGTILLNSFALSVHIKLALPQAAWLSIFFGGNQ